jgi:hypothetical protein
VSGLRTWTESMPSCSMRWAILLVISSFSATMVSSVRGSMIVCRAVRPMMASRSGTSTSSPL